MTQLFEEFQAFRRILCICPCCGDLVRVSDLKLKGKGAIAKTWLDKHQKKEQDMAKKAEKFGEREERLREIAREKGRKEAEKVFLDENLQVERDVQHQEIEERFVAVGKIQENKTLFVVFTLRKDRVRVISARIADKKERSIYDKEIKKNTKI